MDSVGVVHYYSVGAVALVLRWAGQDVVQFLPDLFGLRNILVPGGVLLLAAQKKRCANCISSIGGDMCAGGSSALAATVLAADPFDFSRYGNHRGGLRLAAVSVLCCRQRHRLALDALDWEQGS